MAAPKITLVGAGGMSFGPTMVNDVIHTPALRNAQLVLHDLDATRLERATRFAEKLNAGAGSPVRISRTTDPAAAFDGADFVMTSAERGRFRYWHQDHDVPNHHGARQIMGENGGPGAVFHSLRSITNILSVCRDVERHSPDAFLVNLTNPMSRVTLAINRGTSLRNVGMCHELPMGLNRLSRRLRIPRRYLAGSAAGINHFTFYRELVDTRTGEDLLPRVRRMYESRWFDFPPPVQRAAAVLDRSLAGGFLVEFNYLPLVAHVVRTYGVVPCSVDSHIGEYLPFALDVADWMPEPLAFHEPVMRVAERAASWAADTALPLPLHRFGHSHEEVAPILGAMWSGEPVRITAVNVPNAGYIDDVAEGAIVEVGATVDGDGIHPDSVGALGDPVAGWIAPQTRLQDQIVDAALSGDRDLAFQALRDDPNSPSDPSACRTIFEELASLQAAELPF